MRTAPKRGDGMAGPPRRPFWFGAPFQSAASFRKPGEPLRPAMPGDFRPRPGFDRHHRRTCGQCQALPRMGRSPFRGGRLRLFSAILRWTVGRPTETDDRRTNVSCLYLRRSVSTGRSRDSRRDPEGDTRSVTPGPPATPAWLPFQTSGTSPLEPGGIRLDKCIRG